MEPRRVLVENSDASPLGLPSDVWRAVFMCLEIHELAQIALVCKFFYNISEDELVWKAQYESKLFSTLYEIYKF